MSSAAIISTQTFSSNFPISPINEIVRDNVITTIKQLASNLDVIFISGDDEVGKSTFLSQFAKFEYKSTVSVFLRPVNQFTSNIDNAVFDLCRQLHWLVYNNVDFNFTNGNEDLLKMYFNRLLRKLKSTNPLYILIDGFEHLDSKYVNQLELMLDNLPIGYQNVTLIVSDKNEKLQKLSKSIISITKDIYEDKALKTKMDDKQFAQACESIIIKLSSNRIAAKNIEKTIPWLTKAEDLPLSQSFPIFIAFIENANIWFNKLQNGKGLLRIYFEYCRKNVQMIELLIKKSNDRIIYDEDLAMPTNYSQQIIKPGNKEDAIKFIQAWIRNEVSNYVIICDPYFTAEDLLLVKDIFMINPDVKITILGEFEGNGDNIRQSYVSMWEEICDQDPPDTEIILVGYQNNNKTGKFISPNHDRWYTTYNSGLRVGTSYNSIGNKNSEISIMSALESKNIENEILRKYISRSERYHDNNRLSYIQFNL